MLKHSNRGKNGFRSFAEFPYVKELAFAGLTGLFAGYLSLRIFKESIRQIFHHSIALGGDGSLTGFYLSLVEHNSYWSLLTQHISSANYGWPGHVDFTNYPIGQTFEMLILKLAVSCFGIINPATIIHVVSILKAVPISIATYIFARTIGISKIFASVAGVAYSVSNFNLIRSEGHFLLALTWSLPLALAAIFIGYQDYLKHTEDAFGSKNKNSIFKVCILSFISAFSSYYFSIFILLTYSFVILLTFLNELPRVRNEFTLFKSKKFWLQIIKARSTLFAGFLVSLVGLSFQIIPILLRTSANPQLSSIADRSWTEPIVYGGTLESYFFDLSNLGTHLLHHPEVSPYLQTRTSWEATQTGSTAGLVGYLLVFALVFIVMRAFIRGRVNVSKSTLPIDEKILFLVGIFIFFFALYIVSPFNFAISRILPEIRAWGRVSTVLCLISIILICYLASKIRIKFFGYILVLAVVVAPTLGDLKMFHDSRPTGIQLNTQYLAGEQSLSVTWNKLESTFNKGCALVNLPIYPFPEFDNPTDNNGDYAQLNLVSYKEGYFKWSYPAVKDTAQFSAFQNLVSEQPNFDRASLGYQVVNARSTGACGIVLDRTLLVPTETQAFNEMLQRYPACFVSLGGEQFTGLSRFYSMKFASPACRGKAILNPSLLGFQPASSNFLWRIDQPFSVDFFGGYEMFPPSTSIAFRVAKSSAQESGNALVRVRITQNATSNIPLGTKVCLIGTGRIFPICGLSSSGSQTEIDLQIPSTAISNKYLKLIANLIVPTNSNITTWGLTIK